jgi:hemoglobin-like flavoprotein
MTLEQTRRIRTSWTQVVPVADTAAAAFYRRLFELDPSLRALFVYNDPATQRRKLMQALAMVVAGIDNFARVLPAAQSLGRLHVDFGVLPHHYDTVGTALMDTLAETLGAAFDRDTRAAWSEAYAMLAGAMQEGASFVHAAGEGQSPRRRRTGEMRRAIP